MSKYFERIRTYYEKGIYKDLHLQKLVESGAITETEFEEITSKTYN